MLTSNVKYFRETYFWQMVVVLFCLITTAVFLLVPTNCAYAGIFNVLDDINNWIAGIYKDAISATMRASIEGLNGQQTSNLLTASWNNLFGDDGTTAIAEYANRINSVVVKPIALAIFTLAVLIEFFKISSDASKANDEMPGVRETMTFLVMFLIMFWFISNADKLCIAIYDLVNTIAQKMTGDYDAIKDIAFDSDSIGTNDLGKLFWMAIAASIAFIVSFVVSAITMVVCYARALQLYTFMAFSSLPLSFILIDETRQWGLGFLKSFAAVCLSSCILLFIFYATPMVANVILGKVSGGFDITMIVQMLVLYFLIAYSAIKSGGWARDILGG